MNVEKLLKDIIDNYNSFTKVPEWDGTINNTTGRYIIDCDLYVFNDLAVVVNRNNYSFNIVVSYDHEICVHGGYINRYFDRLIPIDINLNMQADEFFNYSLVHELYGITYDILNKLKVLEKLIKNTVDNDINV